MYKTSSPNDMTQEVIYDRIIVPEDQAQTLFIQTVKTLPAAPIWGEVIFLADGIDRPDEDIKTQEYIEECLRRNIVPFSRMEFGYSYEGKLETPQSQDSPLTFYRTPDHYRSLALRRLLRGGRKNQVKYNLSRIDHFEDATSEWNKGMIDELLADGYLIDIADIWLSSIHQGGYHVGDARGAAVNLDFRRDRETDEVMGIVRVELDRRWDDQNTGKLVNWFGELQKPHLDRVKEYLGHDDNSWLKPKALVRPYPLVIR